jgi:hypothetical protein
MKALGGWPLKAGLSGGLILILASTLNWQRVGESLLATEKQYVLAAFLVLALTPLLTAERSAYASLAANVRLPTNSSSVLHTPRSLLDSFSLPALASMPRELRYCGHSTCPSEKRSSRLCSTDGLA